MKSKKRKAFTLIELLVAMAVLVVIFAMVFTIYFVVVNVFTEESGQSTLRQEAESAMYTLIADLRLAKKITAASNVSVTAWVDKDEDEVQDTEELITYSFSGTSGDPLVRTQDSIDKNMLYNITEFELTYDSTSVDDIHLICVSFTIEKDGEAVSLSSKVKPRNIN
jgi:prepilin-type N-terminal cleavage/methylation domain-containing protein